MNKILFTSIVALVALLFLSACASATTYYVDFKDGSDTNSGTSADYPWQHAPGDPNAGGQVVSSLNPGDSILFKGGVHYRGNSDCISSRFVTGDGTPENPITYKGDGWPEGERAILDGSDPLTDWQACTVEKCGTHPNLDKLYYAYAPAEAKTFTANIHQDDQLIIPAMTPDLPDPFWIDDHNEYWRAEGMTETSVTDSRLADWGSEALVENGYVYAYRGHSGVDFRKIETYDDAGTPKITFYKLTNPPYADPSQWHFAIANVPDPDVFNKPGEFVFNETAEQDGTHKVILWPLNGQDPNTANITVTVRGCGFKMYRNHNTFEGFKIQKYRGAAFYTIADGITGIVIRNNEIARLRSLSADTIYLPAQTGDVTVENNYIHENYGMRIMYVEKTTGRAIIRNNVISKVSSGMRVSSNTEIVNNTISNMVGTHANAITTYGDRGAGAPIENLLIMGNIVKDNVNRPHTIQGATNVIIYNNIFRGKGGCPITAWGSGGEDRDIKIFNNILFSGYDVPYTLYGAGYFEPSSLIIKNNIVSRPVTRAGADITHNVYTFYDPRNDNPHETEIYEPILTNIFENPANDNFHLAGGSPAIDAGADITAILNELQAQYPDYNFFADIEGNPRPPEGAVGSLYSKRIRTETMIQAFDMTAFWILIGAAASTGLILVTLTAIRIKRKILNL